jgi:hypothetical protein
MKGEERKVAMSVIVLGPVDDAWTIRRLRWIGFLVLKAIRVAFLAGMVPVGAFVVNAKSHVGDGAEGLVHKGGFWFLVLGFWFLVRV